MDPVDILIVDDSPAKLLAIETALAPLGERCVTCSSGHDALRHLLARDFATIVLDVSMPDLDGFETARTIRARPRSAHTPIIFVTAVKLDEVDAHMGYSLGAVDYIFAPIEPDVLRAKVAVFVELHRKTQEARLHAARLEERTRELEQSRRSLERANRMASIGTLSAGLGHDIGNLLLPMTAQLDELGSLDLPGGARDGMDTMHACIGHLRSLCTGLRQLALDPDRPAPREDVDISEWWAQSERIFHSALPRTVSLEFHIGDDTPRVSMAQHLLTQAVFNLIQNAGEALAGRPDPTVRVEAEAVHDGVCVRVSDNGPGMSPDVLEHCFDPYFSPKSRDISTGFGLALVHAILQRAGVTIEMHSRQGHGATATFVLPYAPHAPLERTLAAVVTLDDMREAGIARALLRARGFEIVDSLPDAHDRAALWVADPGKNVHAEAGAFVDGRTDRCVFVRSTPGAAGPEYAAQGIATFTIRGEGVSLRARIADFIESLTPPEARYAGAQRNAKRRTHTVETVGR